MRNSISPLCYLMLVWQGVFSYSTIKQHHGVSCELWARIEFSLTPCCSLSKAQIAIYQISFWLFLTPNSPALWGKKSMGIIPNILQKYQGKPFSVMSFLLLIKLFQSLKWVGLIVSQLIMWQELHCNLILQYGSPHTRILMIQFTCKRFKLPHIVGDNFPESDQHQKHYSEHLVSFWQEQNCPNLSPAGREIKSK